MIPSLQFVPRTRRSFEAMDLGLNLLQAHVKPVLGILLLQLAILLALTLPFTWRQPLWTLLILWWLSPWLSRGVLHVLSRRVFGQDAGLMTFLEHARAVHRHGLLASLLWRRVSPHRTFLLPVWQLEMQTGRAFRQRIRILRRGAGGGAFLLCLVCILFMALTVLGGFGVVHMLLPRGMDQEVWDNLSQALDKPWFVWMLTCLGILTIALVEPFYTAAGFALYLNRRTTLEAWDLEQAFRRLASRLASGLSRVSRSAGQVLMLVALLGTAVWAQEAPAPIASPLPPPPVQMEPSTPLRPEDPARAQVQEILKNDPAFREHRTIEARVYKPTGKEPQWLRALLDALFGEREAPSSRQPITPTWLQPVAWILKIFFIALLILGALYLIYRFHHARWPKLEGEDYVAPDAIAGLDIRPSSLPADIPGEALRLFRRGEARQALALLYRGALAALVHGHGLEITDCATEGDCLRMARELPLHEALAHLTQAWIRMAYLGEAPDEARMEALLASWPQAFGPVGGQGARSGAMPKPVRP